MIGARLKTARSVVGMTQADLASRIACSRTLVAMVECGAAAPTRRFVTGAAEAFGLQVEELEGAAPVFYGRLAALERRDTPA